MLGVYNLGRYISPLTGDFLEQLEVPFKPGK